MRNFDWLEMSYNLYNKKNNIKQDKYNNDFYISLKEILEYRDFEEDDYSEESSP